MATIIQQLKGTAAEVAAKTYAAGVLVWNETAKRWHGGDGVTAGGIAMARYDERNEGSLGDTQRVETAASNSVTVADIGKAIVGNRATAIAFNLDPAASLTSKFVGLFKNINAGPMTIVPNGAELIDGANTAVTVPTGSSVIIKGDGTSLRTFLSNGDVTGNAINNAAALTGASLADNDKLGVYDTSATSLAGMTVTEFVAGIFKTARKIANAYFLSSFRLWDAADNTKGLGFVLSGIATATTRLITVPDADVDLTGAQKLSVSGSAPAYACRAWVNFNGTGTVATRASGNVSSITDNGTGDYTINFTTALPDANYGVAITLSSSTRLGTIWSNNSDSADPVLKSTTQLRIQVAGASGGNVDMNTVCVAVFR